RHGPQAPACPLIRAGIGRGAAIRGLTRSTNSSSPPGTRGKPRTGVERLATVVTLISKLPETAAPDGREEGHGWAAQADDPSALRPLLPARGAPRGRRIDPCRSGNAVWRVSAPFLAAGGDVVRTQGRAAGSAHPRRGFGVVPRQKRPGRALGPALLPPRHLARIWCYRRARPTLLLSQLAVRYRRPHPRHARRAGAQQDQG